MRWKNLGQRALNFGTDVATSKVAGKIVSRFGPHRTLGKIAWLLLFSVPVFYLAGYITGCYVEGYYSTIAYFLGTAAGMIGAVALVVNWVIVWAVEKAVKYGVDNVIKPLIKRDPPQGK